MKKTIRKRILAVLLAAMMLVCLLPASALAAGEEDNRANISISADCEEIGVYDEDYIIYYYPQILPAGTTEICFTDLADIMEDGMIASLGNAYVEGTNIAPVNSDYTIDEFDEDWEIDDEYAQFDFEGAYCYWISDDNYDTYFVIVKVNPIPFSASAEGEELSITATKDGYEYYDFTTGSNQKTNLYTVAVPLVYIESIKLDFGDNVFTAYGYDADGNPGDEYYGSDAGQTSVDIPDLDYYIWIQTPWVSDGDTWSGGELQYVVNFKPIFTATISGTDSALTDITCEKNGYGYIAYQESVPVLVDLYTITIPVGTEKIDFIFSDNCLAYNYKSTGIEDDYVVVDDNNGAYITGAVSEYMTGFDAYTVDVDAKDGAGNADGILDYIQVQDPYGSGGGLRYAITFVYDIFGAYVDGKAMTDITATEGGYPTFSYDPETFAPVPGDPVTLYTVVIPDNTERVDLAFPEAVLAYSYKSDGLSYIYGEEFDYTAGVTALTVDVDHNADGEPDYIQVQNLYAYDAETDTSSGGEVLYAITFNCSLETPEGPVEVTLEQLRDNIAAKYAESGVASDSQAPWLAADMAAYEAAFPDKSKLTAEQKQDMIDKAIADIAATSKPGDVAKNVIALAAMGYDPRQLTTAKGEELDAVAKLDQLTISESGAVTDDAGNIYTLPFVIIAYQQFSDCGDQLALLKSAAIEKKDEWLSTEGGTDGLAFMMLALAPYYSENDIKTALDEAVDALKAAQEEDGSLGRNAASTGLALAGLAAINIDPAEVKAGEGEDANSLTDGIMTFAGNDGASIGSNSFDAEQGFRGLVALAKLGSVIYDFSGNISARVPAVATPAKAVVTFSVVPSSAEITVLSADEEKVEPSAASNKTYSLDAGSYTYTVEKEGYTPESGDITVTEEQADAAEEITIKINLSVIEGEEAQLVTITVKVMAHDADTCENSLTYKNDPDKYFSLLGDAESYDVTLNPEDATASDALLAALNEYDVDYKLKGSAYFSSIGGYEEKAHGDKSGWLYIVNGKAADVGASEYKFTKDSTMVWFYTDDYTKDYGGEDFSGGGSDEPAATPGTTAVKPVFEDVPADAYYAAAVDWAVEKGITTGTTETTFSPDDSCTRAQMVTFLWRAAGSPAPTSQETPFEDIDSGEYYYQAVLWAVENGITNGTSETTFGPKDTVTRAQAVTFIYRFAKSPAVEKTAVFTDVDLESYYADAVCWAYNEGVTKGTSETEFSPDADCIRAQIVTFLYRYFEKN